MNYLCRGKEEAVLGMSAARMELLGGCEGLLLHGDSGKEGQQRTPPTHF